MSENRIVEGLPKSDLAAEINRHHRECEAAVKSGLDHALECGRLLLQAKAAAAHGEWLPWVKANCEFTPRAAQGYMRLAIRWPALEAKAKHVSHLPYREALALLAEPKEPEIPAMPAGFTVQPGTALIGEAKTSTIFIAESLEHPGYWNLILIDWQCSDVVGFKRPVHPDALAGVFFWFLSHEGAPVDDFGWHLADAPDNAEALRAFCDTETSALYHDWRAKEQEGPSDE